MLWNLALLPSAQLTLTDSLSVVTAEISRLETADDFSTLQEESDLGVYVRTFIQVDADQDSCLGMLRNAVLEKRLIKHLKENICNVFRL